MTCMAVQVPVHFDGHNINIITEDSPSTVKTRTSKASHKRNSNTTKSTSPPILTNNPLINNNNPLLRNESPSAIILDQNKRSSLIINAQIHQPLQPKMNAAVQSLLDITQQHPQPQPQQSYISTTATLTQTATGVPAIPMDDNFGDYKDEEMMDAAEYDSAQEERASLYKTELCREWSTSGWCYYNKRCSFAHGLQELRPVFRSKKWRTKRCRNWHTTGYCPYEHRCQFLHDQSPPRRIQDYSANTQTAANGQRMQPLYFHYQVEDPNRERKEGSAASDEHKTTVIANITDDGSGIQTSVTSVNGSVVGRIKNRLLRHVSGDEEQKSLSEEPSVQQSLQLEKKTDKRPLMEKVSQNGGYLTLKAVPTAITTSPGTKSSANDIIEALGKRKKKKDAVIIKPFNPMLPYHPHSTPTSNTAVLPPDLYHPNRELTNAQIADYHYWQQLQQQNVANEILASCGVEQIRRILASDPELCRRLNASQAFINQLNNIRPTTAPNVNTNEYALQYSSINTGINGLLTTPHKPNGTPNTSANNKSFEELMSLLPVSNNEQSIAATATSMILKNKNIINGTYINNKTDIATSADIQSLGNANFIDPVLLQTLLKGPNDPPLPPSHFNNNLLSIPNNASLPPMSIPNVSAFADWEVLALASIGNNMSNINIAGSVPNSITTSMLPSVTNTAAAQQQLYTTAQVTQTDVNRINNLLMNDMSPGASPIAVAPVPMRDNEHMGNLLSPYVGSGGGYGVGVSVGGQPSLIPIGSGSDYYTTNVQQQPSGYYAEQVSQPQYYYQPLQY